VLKPRHVKGAVKLVTDTFINIPYYKPFFHKSASDYNLVMNKEIKRII